MGSLAHFNLPGFAVMHGVKHFVETGTAQGESLAMARDVKEFRSLHSVEIVPDLVTASKMRFAPDARIQIWEGDSRSCLPMILRELPADEPVLFWLDAHFPGAHSGAEYDAEADVKTRLPLEDEIDLIRQARGKARDILLIDDARIYINDPSQSANLPDDFPGLQGIKREGIGFIRKAYGSTHGVVVDYADQWYCMVVPKGK